MSAVTIFRIHLTKDGSRGKDSEYSNLDSAVERVKWLMRHHPGCRVTLDVVPPTVRPAADDFEQRLTAGLRGYRQGDMGRAVDDAVLVASWEEQRGDTGEPNPYLTLLQKRTDQHHAAVERAAEEALQGGEYGVRVDVYPTRTEARVDPTVPYGCAQEHQHRTDPRDAP